MDSMDKHIEAILFLKGEPMNIKKLATILGVQEFEVLEAVKKLQEKLQDRGIVLMRKDDFITLVTSPVSSEFTKVIIGEEFNTGLTKVALETLAIVVYKGPISRTDIDYIRGVNSSFVLRNLLVRGLVERVDRKSVV